MIETTQKDWEQWLLDMDQDYGRILRDVYDRWQVGPQSSIYVSGAGKSTFRRTISTTGDKALIDVTAQFGSHTGINGHGHPYWNIQIAPVFAKQGQPVNPNLPSSGQECAHCGLMYATNQADDNGYCATCLHKGVPVPDDSALATQVGGNHYKNMKIQPVEFAMANNLNFLQGCIIKRVCRHGSKNGLEDLMKAKHEIDLLIELEYTAEE